MAIKSEQEADVRKHEQEQLMATHQWAIEEEGRAHEQKMAEEDEKKRQHEREMEDKKYREDTSRRKHERDILAMQQKHESTEAEKKRKHERDEAEKKRQHEVDQNERRIKELQIQLQLMKAQKTRTKFGNGTFAAWNRVRVLESEDSDVNDFKG